MHKFTYSRWFDNAGLLMKLQLQDAWNVVMVETKWSFSQQLWKKARCEKTKVLHEKMWEETDDDKTNYKLSHLV